MAGFRYRVRPRLARCDAPCSTSSAAPSARALAEADGARLRGVRRLASRSRTASRGCSTTGCPGIAEKRREIEGWVELARAQGWYEPEDEVDAVLPFVCRDLGWDDRNWRANEHSFSLLLDRYVRPGMRVLEVGAAKCWGAQHLVPRGCEYVGVDILADPKIGLGRGAFYEERVGPFGRVQADGEHLPFATRAFDLTYCVARSTTRSTSARWCARWRA